MNYGRVLGQYKKTSIATSNRLELVIICYDKAIESFTRAGMHFREKEYEQKALHMQKGLDIVNELQCSLDMEKGGEIAVNLDRIYTYITYSLIQGDINSDPGVFDEAVSLLKDLKEAWEGIAGKTEHAMPSEQTSIGHAAAAQVAA